MGPRPYSEKASIPNDSAINEFISTVPTQILPESPSPSTNSATTTPSPTLQEIIPVEQHVDNTAVENEHRIDTILPYYPTPDDIMPYDHSLPDFIRQITNQPNLSILQSLSLRVISSCISLHRMAAYLPSLKELNLEGSILNSLRDIGCSFKNLQILKVNCCQLESLDGTFGLSTLRELYAQKNLINDISPCSNLPHIKHIDVSWNKIRNISYTGFLTACKKLKSIVFTGNPATEVADYRKYVRKILPQIETLDGINFESEAEESETTDHFGYESDSSSEVPDFFSVSTSDSLNNLLESEEDVNLFDKKSRLSKNISCLDPNDATEIEVQDILRNSEQTKMDTNKNLSIKQKSTIMQKLDKDNENRSKKSNEVVKLNFNREAFFDQTNFKNEHSSNHDLSSDKNKSMDENFPSAFRIQGESSTSFNIVTDETKFGALKKKPLTSENVQSVRLIPDKFNFEPPVSSLTTGLPIRGNLTAALRNRNKVQNFNNAMKLSISNDYASEQAGMEKNIFENINENKDNFHNNHKDFKEK